MTMSLQSIRSASARKSGRGLLLGLAAALAGCGLDEVSIPELNGPSTHAISLVLSVTPDVLLADAVSRADVLATVRGPDGQGLAGRTVFFAVTDENGNYVDLGTFNSTVGTFHPPAPQTTEVTDGNGVARVSYRVPERISVTAVQVVFITARLVGDDAEGQSFRRARIELRPAEVRRFPDPGGAAVTCNFVVDPEVGPYQVNEVLRFFTTSTGGIVQYHWDFGDGGTDDKPDVQHHWRAPGGYSVTHVVTAGNGISVPCSRTIVIVN
jgi:PKD repeat protein